MKVFNACLLIVRRHAGAFVLYFVIFMTLSVVMATFYAETVTTDFSKLRPNFTLVNRDGASPLSDGLRNYLLLHGSEVVLEDSREALQDASFFHATDYIAILPEGFRDAFFAGTPLKIQCISTTESAKGYYADSLLNQYLNLARVYAGSDSGMDESHLVSLVLNDLSIEAGAQKKRFGAGSPIGSGFQVFSRMGSYIILVLLTLCTSNVMMAFRRPDLRMRNLCAPVRPRSMSVQQIMCAVLFGLLAWILLTALGFAVYGSGLSGTDRRIIGLILLNTFVNMLVALSISSLAGSFVHSVSTKNAIANFLSLALSFLGGVFVPLELLGGTLLTVSRFTPTYWFVKALDDICSLTSFESSAIAPVWQAMLTQLAFASAILCVTLVVGKYQTQSEHSFGSVRTELES